MAARKTKGDYLMAIDPAARAVITSDDQTRKYILLTNLVAKITDPLVHSRALQVTSRLKNPYNARTLCSSVVRPFVLESLNNCWPAGEDPLVSNPARFPEVSSRIRAKSGLSRQILRQLIEFLDKINSLNPKATFKQLSLILKYLLDSSPSREPGRRRVLRGLEDGNPYGAAIKFAERTLGGHTTALLTDVCIELIFGRVEGDFKVSSHAVNQSDASPQGILDCDAILGKKSFLSLEVKDKSIGPLEIESLKSKANTRGLSNYGLVLGLHGSASTCAMNTIPTIDIRSLIATTALLLGPEFNMKFIRTIKKRILTKRVSPQCKAYARQCFNF